MRNVKLTIEYDGTDFYGFQKQPARRTVQGEIELALKRLLGEVPRVVSAGRTDAGVHATGQVISFDADRIVPTDRIGPALNGLLPKDIRVKKTEAVPDGFHARYSAKARTYVYTVLNRESPSAILERYAWRVTKALQIDNMASAAAELIGIRDFASFGMPDRKGASTVREVTECRVWRWKDAVLIRITANAFLRGMARAIVGTLVDAGRGNRPPEDIVRMLEAHDRRAAGAAAPPQGLCLVRVQY